jgi:hypothetical protein
MSRPFAPPDRPDESDDEDLAQAIALARLAAERHGFDPDAAEAEAVAEHAAAGRQLNRERPEADVRANFRLDWLPEARRVRSLATARPRTEGQRRKATRDAIILAASVAGFPQRAIAMAFGLPHSRVSVILAKMRPRLAAGSHAWPANGPSAKPKALAALRSTLSHAAAT